MRLSKKKVVKERVYDRLKARYYCQTLIKSKRLQQQEAFDLHEEHIGRYFDGLIESAIRNEEDESYENLDQPVSPSIDIERLLRKAKIDSLNLLSLGCKASRLQYSKDFKVLSI